ncbi:MULTISPECIES: hypothetical protein [Sorangium]|uniref:Uncharacterized protein n=1 Tax=Sorangium cellulosum TaxID=56 RepID=A0A4P2QWY0_SORCE|nr:MULTISPECIES: hypothetical protein [Sorangium]AUX35030.1 hypothetical protein SOCE836_072180 [Sorangium cellulosum]WCQ94335.1 hypothetical protein NQZ70_07100 [Sorangium sp. Soce836]
MKREPRPIRSAVSCAGLCAVVAGGCNAIIGLEVGELDPSQSGAGAAPGATSSAASSGEGGTGAGGMGAGGMGAGGTGEGGSGAAESGGGGSGAGGAGGGGGSGGGAPMCSEAPGAIIEPSAAWGETLGFDVGDLTASGGALTAVATDVLEDSRYQFTVAKWSAAGARDGRYGLSVNDIWGLHLAAGKDFTYVAGESDGATNLPTGSLSACRIGPGLLDTAFTTSFVAALGPEGKCGWVWSVDAAHGTTARGLAATSEALVFAVDVTDAGRSFGPCALRDIPQESALLAALHPQDGACRWQHRLGPRAAVTVKAIAANSRSGSRFVTVVGDYDSLSGDVSFGGDLPFASVRRDVFIARYVTTDGALQDVKTLNVEGDQQVAQHGAALLPGGDVVIAGTYRGRVRFEERCPPLPDAGETENFFIARVSDDGVVWSRGFGDATESQVAAGVAVDEAGSIYVTGEFTGALPLGGAGALTTSRKRAGFLMRLDARGNLVSAAQLEGDGTVALRVVAANGASGDPLYVAGAVTGTLHLPGLDEPLGSDSDPESHGFIARLSGVR